MDLQLHSPNAIYDSNRPNCISTLTIISFPPAPLALVDSKTGGVQSPKAGVLGSHDSATGAPEKHKGEAVEQEASNFVSSIGHIALSSAAGKHDQGDQNLTLWTKVQEPETTIKAIKALTL